jgi:hypothetical protein
MIIIRLWRRGIKQFGPAHHTCAPRRQKLEDNARSTEIRVIAMQLALPNGLKDS